MFKTIRNPIFTGHTRSQAEIPAIDRAAPAITETATLALG